MIHYVLVLMLLLVGCIPGGEQAGGTFLAIDVTPLGDRSGLILMDEDTTTIPTVIEIRNPMRQDARNVRIVPSNVNTRIVNMAVIGEQSFTLPGTNTLEGSPGVAIIEADIGIALQKRDYSTRIDYHVCAITTTAYEDTICVAPPGITSYSEDGCTPGDVSVTGGQGAPVAVVAMRQLDAPNSVSIMFDLVNYGSGIVFDPTSDSCSYIDQAAAGKITLTDLVIGNASVDCTRTEQRPTRRMGFDQKYQRYTGVTFQCVIDKNVITDGSIDPVARPVRAVFEYNYHTKPVQQVVAVKAAPGYPHPNNPATSVPSTADTTVLTQAIP
jgi:hypothetical protein